MIELEELLPDVLVHVPACPEPLAIRYLREAAMQLCEASLSWRESETLKVTTPECEAVMTTQDAQIIRIEAAYLDQRPLEAVDVAWLDDNQPGWEFRYTDNDGMARYIVQKAWNTVAVVPRQPGDLSVRLILKPSRDALTIPEAIADRWHDALAGAAAAKVLLTNNLEIANPQLGAALWGKWEQQIDSIRVKEQMTQLRTKARTKPSYF
ncbi:hypothetical protein [Phreatobacter oligotrophus]|uniref:Uncharacterized protein n=1 Tax=Phreatobacter oligotrophus TaxID=1122261 RepID=A0A2T4ZIU0_9HYPH|nr:hypothetical protein [Phreatobacter oligotrophus]PTM61900.1 hypothetical protein C8P69_101572 [Phreatobacter oligotrophus]